MMLVKELYKKQEEIEQSRVIEEVAKETALKLMDATPRENVDGYDIRTFGSLIQEYFNKCFELEFMEIYMNEADNKGYE